MLAFASGKKVNRYVYANNSPYNHIDPDGREAKGIEVTCMGSCTRISFASGENLDKADSMANEVNRNLVSAIPLIGSDLAEAGYGEALSAIDPVHSVTNAVREGQQGHYTGAAIAVAGAVIKPLKLAPEVEVVAKELNHHSKEFNGALSKAVSWLSGKGFSAQKITLGKFGSNAGKAIGMQTSDGKVGFRVEYDARNGAHINVWAGKEKGPHFTFDANSATVDKITKLFQ